MQGFPLTWWRASLWHPVFGTGLLVGMGWARAGFWSAGLAHLDGMLGGVLVGSKIAGIAGEGFLVGRGLSSWKGFFRHGDGFLGLLVDMGWARAGFWSAGFAEVREMLEGSWWAPEWQVLLGGGFQLGMGSFLSLGFAHSWVFPFAGSFP